MTLPKSDFWRHVATQHRALRDHVKGMPVNQPDSTPQPGGIDPSVKEQVISDLDKIADSYAPEPK